MRLPPQIRYGEFHCGGSYYNLIPEVEKDPDRINNPLAGERKHSRSLCRALGLQ